MNIGGVSGSLEVKENEGIKKEKKRKNGERYMQRSPQIDFGRK